MKYNYFTIVFKRIIYYGFSESTGIRLLLLKAAVLAYKRKVGRIHGNSLDATIFGLQKKSLILSTLLACDPVLNAKLKYK